MKVKFKGSEKSYVCTEPIEQKLFKLGQAVGWLILFSILEDIGSSELDELLTQENVSELTFQNDAGKEISLSGYSAVTSCTIRHKESAPVVELQMTRKYATSDKKEGDDTNV